MNIVEILSKVGFDWRLFVFNVFNFTVVAGLVYFFFFKKIQSVLNARQKLIQESLDKSSAGDEALAEAESKAAELVAEAREKAKKMSEEASQQTKEWQAEQRAEAKKQSAAIIAQAEAQAETVMSEKMAEFNQKSVELIVASAKKLAQSQKLDNKSDL